MLAISICVAIRTYMMEILFIQFVAFTLMTYTDHCSCKRVFISGVGSCSCITVHAVASYTDQTNEGNEFFVGFFRNRYGNIEKSEMIPPVLWITTKESTPVSVNVFTITGLLASDIVTPGQITYINIPINLVVYDSSEDSMVDSRYKGIRVKAQDNKKIVVFGQHEEIASNDAYLALPIVSLPTGRSHEYIVASIFGDTGTAIQAKDSVALIVGTENNTEIILEPSVVIRHPFAPAATGRQFIPGVPVSFRTITIQSFQTFYLQVRGGDISGTRIIADKPISVFSGHECADVPLTCEPCDILIEQIPPIDTWGTEVVTIPLRTRSGDILKVFASQDSTAVNVTYTDINSGVVTSDSFSFTLNRNGFRELGGTSLVATEAIADFALIQSNNPIAVFQFSRSCTTDHELISDPFMLSVPPCEQYRDSFAVTPAPFHPSIEGSVLGRVAYVNYTNIAVPAEYFNASLITVNNNTINASEFRPIRRADNSIWGYGAQLLLDEGAQMIRHQDPNAALLVTMYGFSNQMSWGCAGGTGLTPVALAISPPPQIYVHPLNKTVGINNGSTSITFTCMANGSRSYSWQRDTGSIPSSAMEINSNCIMLFNILPPDSGNYRCLATNEHGTTYSKYAMLTVKALPPVVFIAPAGKVVVKKGTYVEFNCLATGVGAANFKYQWFLNNEPIAHQDTRTLIVTSVSTANTGDYTCSVLNPYEVTGQSNNTATLILEQFCNPVAVSYTGFNITWNETLVDVTVKAPCTGAGLSGTVSRKCIIEDQWQETINCFRRETGILFTKVVNLTMSLNELNETEIISEASIIADALANVTSSTEESIFAADITLAVGILSALNNITETVISNLTPDDPLIEGTISVLNNLLSDAYQNSWEKLERTSPSTSQDLVHNAEWVTSLLSATLTNSTTEAIKAKPNIVLKAERLSNETFDDGYVFPDEDDDLIAYTGRSAQVMVPSGLLQEISGNTKELTIASIVIRDDTGFRLPSNGSTTPRVLASPIFSLQIDPLPDSATLKNNPIMMMFDIALSLMEPQNLELDDASCNFYNYSLIIDDPDQVGGWSTVGLTLGANLSHKTSVTCLTTHLTSFAVLVSIQDERPPSPADKALSIISYIGCSMSLICLCISIVFLIYTIYKSKGEINHLFVHLNLCIALALGLIVFIAGIESATSNKVACKVVAVLLQYFFISAFCWMLSEGVMLYMMLVTVFGNKFNKRRYFFILGWAPAIPIVAISAGIAHVHYGTDHYCWIKSDDGAIAAFIVPIVVIILINCVFLAITLKVLWVRQRKTMNKKVSPNIIAVKGLLKAIMVLLPVLGLTWLIGIIAVNNETQVLAWIFAILNSLQGVFIFIFHVMRNDQVAEQMRDWFASCISGNTSTFGVPSKAKSSQNSSSKVSGHSKKILTTSFGGGIAGRDYLSSNLETNLSKEDSIAEDDNQIKLITFRKLEELVTEEHEIKVKEKELVKDNRDIEEEGDNKSITEDIKKENKCNTEVEGAFVGIERSVTATTTKPTPLPSTMK